MRYSNIGPGPAEKDAAASHGGVRATQGKPVLERNIASGNRDKAAQPGFACQKIVVRPVAAPFRDVVADREQSPLAIVEKLHVDLVRQGPAVRDQPFSEAQHLAGQPAGRGECVQHPIEPGGVSCPLRSIPYSLEDRDAADASVGKVAQRRGARQILAHRPNRLRTQQFDVLFRLLGEDLHPAQVAVRDVPRGRCLPLQLFGPITVVLFRDRQRL